jgi:plasmid rolling circle replication initiator protein Rep
MPTEDGFDPSLADEIYLSEISPGDKPWEVHRAQADKVRDLYRGSDFDRYAERIDNCSRVLEACRVTREDGALGLKITNTGFCRVRLCTVCQWRRQLKWRARFFNALPFLLAANPKARFLFLTLTARNCKVEELRDTLTWMNKSWERFTKRRQFPALGWLKSVEVTRGKHGDSHPHFHAILMVNPSFFTHGYLSHEKWVELWRDSLGVQYLPSVRIKVIKARGKKVSDVGVGLSKALCETLKYSVKPDDLITDRDFLLGITAELHKTRAVAVGGEFRKFISDKEPEDLLGDDEDPDCDSDGIIWFGWREKQQRYSKLFSTDLDE